MTRQEILTEVMIQAIDQPESDMIRFVQMIRECKPHYHWDEEVTGHELHQLRSNLKSETPYVEEWIFAFPEGVSEEVTYQQFQDRLHDSRTLCPVYTAFMEDLTRPFNHSCRYLDPA